HNLKIKDLKLAPSYPLDTRNFKGRKTKLQNNCSGKHIMMLLMCKYKGFNLDYTNINHPLQKLIKKKQEELCKYKSNTTSYDGCGTPLWAIPYKNIIIAYNSLCSDKKYEPLLNSIQKYPDLFGGYDRLDSELIKLSKGKLFSKVGAGGLVLIRNNENKNTVLIKMAHDDNPARKLVCYHILNKLNWIDKKLDLNIYNQQNTIVATWQFAVE
ncbi:asparaginase, partial [bacterium]|nr:asparaginase [bacterium]